MATCSINFIRRKKELATLQFRVKKGPNSLVIKGLGRPAPRKSLIVNDLRQTSLLLHFFLAVFKKLAYYTYMKAREIKIRKAIVFTKSRPHKIKNKVLHRKQKHKEALNVYS